MGRHRASNLFQWPTECGWSGGRAEGELHLPQVPSCSGVSRRLTLCCRRRRCLSLNVFSVLREVPSGITEDNFLSKGTASGSH